MISCCDGEAVAARSRSVGRATGRTKRTVGCTRWCCASTNLRGWARSRGQRAGCMTCGPGEALAARRDWSAALAANEAAVECLADRPDACAEFLDGRRWRAATARRGPARAGLTAPGVHRPACPVAALAGIIGDAPADA